MEIILILFIFAAFVFVALKLDEQKEKDKEEKTIQERRKQIEQKRLVAEKEYENLLAALSVRFGECTIKEKWNMGMDVNAYSGQEILSSSVLVFEQSEIIVIKSKEYKFSDILGYNIVDNITNETVSTSNGTAKMSTGSMLGRTIAGGMLAGGLGAVAGAMTADRDISDITTSESIENHDYALYINVNDLHEPVICLCIGFLAPIVQKIAGILNIIIERNKQKDVQTQKTL